jgi:hypothetical protein
MRDTEYKVDKKRMLKVREGLDISKMLDICLKEG